MHRPVQPHSSREGYPGHCWPSQHPRKCRAGGNDFFFSLFSQCTIIIPKCNLSRIWESITTEAMQERKQIQSLLCASTYQMFRKCSFRLPCWRKPERGLMSAGRWWERQAQHMASAGFWCRGSEYIYSPKGHIDFLGIYNALESFFVHREGAFRKAGWPRLHCAIKYY